ncbi:MAG: hypothetical protein LW636_04315 [Planctomycetaceae bacterium]|nr:hypothetical protein [Planctomycetaceae bacterium]
MNRTPALLPLMLAAAALGGASMLVGCMVPKRAPNPSFAVTNAEAASDLRRMRESPRKLFTEFTFEGARQQLLRELALAFGTDLDHLPEVDVVAFSMGGLVARAAAIPDESGRFLPIRRLYSLSVPHEGARLAGVPFGIPQGDDMRPGSPFLLRLAAAPRDYELVCYTRLDDVTVGEEFAAPEGEPLWWVPTPSGEYAHMQAFEDPRIQADIARRLRGEEPFGRPPAAPLPN